MPIKSRLALALLAFGLVVADRREALADASMAVTVHNNTSASVAG